VCYEGQVVKRGGVEVFGCLELKSARCCELEKELLLAEGIFHLHATTKQLL
jgi:hypothetical protein